MKKLFLYSCVAVIAAFSACNKKEDVAPSSAQRLSSSNASQAAEGSEDNTCYPVTVDFMAGQHILAGDITVSNDATNMYVTFTTVNGWQLLETHLYVGPLSGMPANKKGNPKIGNFPYKNTADSGATSYTYTIPLSSLGKDSCIAVAAHASVAQVGPNGEVLQQQTAWGAGTQITDGGSWASYFTYCLCNGTTTGGNTGGGTTGGGNIGGN